MWSESEQQVNCEVVARETILKCHVGEEPSWRVTMRSPCNDIWTQIEKFLWSRPQHGHCFSKPSSGFDCAVRNNAKVWLCFDALSHKYNQSLFQQVHLLTVEMLLWSSMLHLPVFTYHSSYSIQRCDCVCFPSTCDVTGLFLSALNTCPLAVTHSLLLSSQCFTHSCLFLSPNLQILCTQVDLLFSSSKVFFMRMCSGACWGCSLFPFLSLAQPPTLHSEST